MQRGRESRGENQRWKDDGKRYPGTKSVFSLYTPVAAAAAAAATIAGSRVFL